MSLVLLLIRQEFAQPHWRRPRLASPNMRRNMRWELVHSRLYEQTLFTAVVRGDFFWNELMPPLPRVLSACTLKSLVRALTKTRSLGFARRDLANRK